MNNLIFRIKKYGARFILFSSVVYLGNFLEKFFDPINNYLLDKLKGIPLIFYNYIIGIINIKIPLYLFIVGLLFIWLFNKIYVMIKIKFGKLKIIRAFYGKDDKIIDITNILNEKIENNRIKITLNNDIDGDPICGVVKEGKVRYKYNGVVLEKKYKEHDVIDLP